MNLAFFAVMAGVLSKAPISSSFFGSKQDSLCVLMDLCGGVWPHGSGSAEKTAQSCCWTGFDAILKYLTVLIAFALFPSFFPHQSIKR